MAAITKEERIKELLNKVDGKPDRNFTVQTSPVCRWMMRLN